VRLIAAKVLREFGEKHPNARASLASWRTVIEAGTFATAEDVLRAFSKAKQINGVRVPFEIAGGDYRLIATFNWRRQIAFVKFLGTHAEYDDVDAATVAQF
jgi:mRNA interferase HigB